jgi:ribosomal protein S18 acetylase RimI-like enzyme
VAEVPAVRYDIEFVALNWSRFDETLRLAFAVLYQPFGLSWPEETSRGADWMHPEHDTLVAVGIAGDGVLLGSARMLPSAGDVERQIRQVAVSPDARRLGVGRALMLALESRAAEEGARETWLNARDSAYRFYEALGYVLEGPEFVSEVTGIPHRAARKRLG